MTVSMYPATCGGCVIAIDDRWVSTEIRKGRRTVCPNCGKVFHHGGTMDGAVRKLLAIRTES
jgi:hypothetical protein